MRKAQGARLATYGLDRSALRYRKHERARAFDVDLSIGGAGSPLVVGRLELDKEKRKVHLATVYNLTEKRSFPCM